MISFVILSWSRHRGLWAFVAHLVISLSLPPCLWGVLRNTVSKPSNWSNLCFTEGQTEVHMGHLWMACHLPKGAKSSVGCNGYWWNQCPGDKGSNHSGPQQAALYVPGTELDSGGWGHLPAPKGTVPNNWPVKSIHVCASSTWKSFHCPFSDLVKPCACQSSTSPDSSREKAERE